MEDLTKKIKEILDTPDKEIDITVAATVLLKINRNQILYQNIIRKRNAEKLKYELKKIYDFRVNENAIQEVKAMEGEIKTIIETTLPKIEKIEAEDAKGKRPDHDNLPDEIKVKFLENQNIFPRMRKLHEQLKLMGNAKACDRYPFLKELKDLDEKLRKNWDEYDAFRLPPVTPFIPIKETKAPAIVSSETSESVIDAKKISAARKYLSDNKAKLKDLKEQEDQTKYIELLKKMQERLTLLIVAQAGVSDDYLKELEELGLNA